MIVPKLAAHTSNNQPMYVYGDWRFNNHGFDGDKSLFPN